MRARGNGRRIYALADYTVKRTGRFHIMIPHLMPNMPQPQRQALAQNVARAVRFYRMLGFEVVHGGDTDAFTSFRAGRS